MPVRGWVYVITNKAMPDLVKIGYSTKDPILRAKELDGTGTPHAFEVVYDALVIEPREVEQKAHKVLLDFKEGKEWFRCSLGVAVSAIKQSTGTILQENSYRNMGDQSASKNSNTNCIHFGCTASSFKEYKGRMLCTSHWLAERRLDLVEQWNGKQKMAK